MLPGPSLVDLLQALLPTLGIPLVVAVFYVNGTVVGKFFPPAAVYLAYLALARPTGATLVLLVVACTAATTAGQWTLYRTLNGDRPAILNLRRRLPWLAQLPKRVRGGVGERRLQLLTRNFDRFGGPALTVTNLVPGLRSFMTIPAGIARYPIYRFLAFTTLGNLVYVVVLTVAGRWLLGVFERLVGGLL